MAKKGRGSPALKNVSGTKKAAPQAEKAQRNDDENDSTYVDSGDDHDETQDEDDESSRSEDESETPVDPTPQNSRYDKLPLETMRVRLRSTLEQLAMTKGRLRDARQKSKEESKVRGTLRHRNKKQSDRIKALEHECKELRETDEKRSKILKERTSQFANTVQELSARHSKSVYPSCPDDIVGQRFKELFNRCRNWAKRWYSRTISDEAKAIFDNVIKQCTAEQRNSVDNVLLEKLTGGDDVVFRELGFACLTQDMMQAFFANPFFAFGKERAALDEFYAASKQHNLRKACTWRAETVRLRRENLGVRPCQLRNDDTNSEAIARVYAHLVNKILHGSQSALLREIEKDQRRSRRSDLTDICHDFCLLAFELWSQKSDIEMVKEAILLQQPFSITSTLLQPCISMGMDNNDRKLDDVLPHAVLVPAVQVFGDANGDNLDLGRVLSRSIIFIDDEIPLVDANIPTTIDVQKQPETSAGQQTAAKVLRLRSGKKRTSLATLPPPKRHRATKAIDLTLLSGAEGNYDHTKLTSLSNDKKSSINILNRTEQGEVLAHADKGLHDATQKKHDLSALIEPISPRNPVSSHNDQSNSDPSQPPGDLEDEKRAEDLHDKQVTPVSQPEEKQLSGTTDKSPEDTMRDESGKDSPRGEEDENGMTEAQLEATEGITS